MAPWETSCCFNLSLFRVYICLLDPMSLFNHGPPQINTTVFVFDIRVVRQKGIKRRRTKETTTSTFIVGFRPTFIVGFRPKFTVPGGAWTMLQLSHFVIILTRLRSKVDPWGQNSGLGLCFYRSYILWSRIFRSESHTTNVGKILLN